MDYGSSKSHPRVSIIVGHNKEKPGALAVAPLSKHEYDYNRSLAQKLSVSIKDFFTPTIYFRDGLTIPQTYDIVEKAGTDFNLELHFNASPDKRAYGTQVLCSTRNQNFAATVQEHLCIALNRDKKGDRGVVVVGDASMRGFASVSRLNAPNVLIEPFFGTNQSDCLLMLENEEKVCLGIEAALLKWITMC